MKTKFEWMVPIIAVVAGAIALFIGSHNLYYAQISSNWPSVQGVIVESSLDTRHTSSGTSRHTEYSPEILYKFVVGNMTFNGNNITYGGYDSSFANRARSVVNSYSKHKKVAVYYMPNNPEESVLEPGVSWHTLLMPAAGLIVFIIGLGTLFKKGEKR